MAAFCPLLYGLITTIPLDFSEGRKSHLAHIILNTWKQEGLAEIER